DGTWGAPVAVRAARRVREAARGNPTAETPAGRPGPTSPLRPGNRPAQPGLGPQATAAAPVHRGRAPAPRRPPPAAAARRDLALGHPDHRRDHPPSRPRPRLTKPNRPCARSEERRERKE